MAGIRDTAKDIILGTNPSGSGPRNAREGRLGQQSQVKQPPQDKRQQPPSAQPPPRQPPQQNGYRGPDPAILQAQLAQADRGNKGLTEEVLRLQNQLHQFQRTHDDSLRQEQDARRRLEASLKANQDNMGRLSDRMRSAEGAGGRAGQQDLEEVKRSRAQAESNMIRMSQDISSLKSLVERHSMDMMQLNNEIKSRPIVDPSKMNNTGHLDARVRDLHGELMGLRQMIDGESNERKRNDQEHALSLQRLVSQLQSEDQKKQGLLQQLAQKGDLSNKELSEEAKRLNEKIKLITDEVTRNVAAKEQAIRDENNQKYLALEKAIKAELEARLQYERDIRAYLENKWKSYSDELDDLKESQTGDKQKFKERFLKLNEALAILERHLEQGGKKMDRVVAAEIQSRKLHEKGLLAKLTEVEDKLGGHLTGLNKAIDDTKKSGKADKNLPNIDTDALKREMEVIAADKQKLSMEGLLKLEEKMQRIEGGLDRDSRELKDKIDTYSRGSESGGDSDGFARVRHQLRKLDDTQEEIERAHDRVREKVERQIPEDLNELAMKLDNAKRQLNDRVDKEEQERYLAIKEIQDEISKLKGRSTRDTGAPAAAGAAASGPVVAELQRDVDECKIGIKKLAEAVTTVKNVLDRRINEEARSRERDVEKIQGAVDKWKK